MNPTSLTAIESFLPEILGYPIFQGFPREAILQLLSEGRYRSTSHRQNLYQAGEAADSFALVLRGAYKLVRPSPLGDDVIVYFSCPGDVIGALLMPQPSSSYPVTVVSMGPSGVWSIPRRTYLSYWSKNPEIVLRMQSLLYHRMSLLQDEKMRQKSPNSQKVAHLLIQLMEKYSGEFNDEGVLPIPITRKEIADAIGSTPESVIRIMSDWSHQGIIRTTDHHIEILKTASIVKLLQDS
ncbi:MAG TPA: Crp/Fnr family transcriptional regulator [Pseudobdellovibrionaceae bacterium]|nr:Crp/Fnr family transcriptional regulator [Pseudobdellovibrionaceae bacterium]